MSRVLFALLALAAAVYADEYAFNQVDEIVDRIEVCLEAVPERPSSFYVPAQECVMKARWSLDDGDSKESLAQSVAACLTRQKVDAAIVATAQQCLAESLAKDLESALEEADYSSNELSEISSRIASCLSSIPETTYVTPASDCRNDALLEAQDGYPKESLVKFIVPCLEHKNIAAATVAAAKTCLTATLAKDL